MLPPEPPPRDAAPDEPAVQPPVPAKAPPGWLPPPFKPPLPAPSKHRTLVIDAPPGQRIRDLIWPSELAAPTLFGAILAPVPSVMFVDGAHAEAPADDVFMVLAIANPEQPPTPAPPVAAENPPVDTALPE